MAVVIQEVCGTAQDSGYFFPTHLGRGAVAELLPHRRRDSREEGVVQSWPSDWASWSVDRRINAAFLAALPAARCCRPPTPELALRDTQREVHGARTCAPKQFTHVDSTMR